MHFEHLQLLALFFLLTTSTTSTTLSALSPIFPSHALRLSPRGDDPATSVPFKHRPFNPPTCSPPYSDTPSTITSSSLTTSHSRPFLLKCKASSASRCPSPDLACIIHQSPLKARKRRPMISTPVTTALSRNLPLRCSRNCFCDSLGQVTCANDERFSGAKRSAVYVFELGQACQKICGCVLPDKGKKEEGEVSSGPSGKEGKQLKWREGRLSPALRGDSPPYRGSESPLPKRIKTSPRPGFMSPPAEGSHSPRHREGGAVGASGAQNPSQRENRSPPRARFISGPPQRVESPSRSRSPSPPSEGDRNLAPFDNRNPDFWRSREQSPPEGDRSPPPGGGGGGGG